MSSLRELKQLFDSIPKTIEGICVCGNEGADLHHLVPQSMGGTRWRTLWLCPTCHDKVHAQARVQISKNPETRKKQYLNADDIPRLQPIVDIACLAKRLYEDNKSLYENVAIQAITIPVSPAQLKRLHQMKELKGHPSLDSFLLALVEYITKLKSIPKADGII